MLLGLSPLCFIVFHDLWVSRLLIGLVNLFFRLWLFLFYFSRVFSLLYSLLIILLIESTNA